MHLLNYKNVHFNLIVEEDHPLVSPESLPDLISASSQKSSEDASKEGRDQKKKKDFFCKKCQNYFNNNTSFMNHLKGEHKDEYIILLETKIKEHDKYKEEVNIEKKESNMQIHKLVGDLEKIKIENKELKSVKQINRVTVIKTPGDNYDQQDEVEFDSETVILRGKQNGFRRNSPQANSTPMFTCSECDYTLQNKRSLDKHMKRHTEFQIKCRKCSEPFKNDNDLQNHIKNNHKILNQLNCMSCDFQTNQKELLKSHVNFKHTKEKDREVVNCDKCPMEFMTLWTLRNHNRDVHGPKEECIFFKQNRCKFNKSCWKLHVPSQKN